VNDATRDLSIPSPVHNLYGTKTIPDERRHVVDRRYDFTSGSNSIEMSEYVVPAVSGDLGADKQRVMMGYMADVGINLETNDPAGNWRKLEKSGAVHPHAIAMYSTNVFSGVRQHFFMAEDLVMDLSDTSIKRVRPMDLCLPFAAYYLHLPKGVIRDKFGGHLSYIGVSYTRDSEDKDSESAKLRLHGAISGGKESDVSYQCTVMNHEPMDTTDRSPQLYGYLEFEGRRASEDVSMIERIKQIFVGSCAYMGARGSEQFRDSITKAKQQSQKSGGKWTLRMIGERHVSASRAITGTHQGPCPHYRRGHIRMLGESVVWVRPCFVNFKDTDALAT
jgi:hypothetical protein